MHCRNKYIPACRHGAWPIPAETTFPMSTSEICNAPSSIPVRDNAPWIATEPSSVAFLEESDPRNFAIGVLAKLTMTPLLIMIDPGLELKKIFEGFVFLFFFLSLHYRVTVDKYYLIQWVNTM